MGDFWDSLLKLEGLWNSPLRMEILRVVATGAFFILGVVAGQLWAMWRRHRQKQIALRGVSEDVVTIEKILLDRRDDGTQVMRIRSCGRDPMETVFPNQAARDDFQSRTATTTMARPLVSMDGKMGSYLLQELAIWVCGQLRERGFRHDVWVMAPVYERGALYLGGHFLSTVILIRREDLLQFRDWDDCTAIEVEHASHGERILTLMAMAAEFEGQEAAIATAGPPDCGRTSRKRCIFSTSVWTRKAPICRPRASVETVRIDAREPGNRAARAGVGGVN